MYQLTTRVYRQSDRFLEGAHRLGRFLIKDAVDGEPTAASTVDLTSEPPERRLPNFARSELNDQRGPGLIADHPIGSGAPRAL